MNYSETELQQIEKYASIYLPISDIATLIDVAPEVLRDDIKDKSSPAGKAYNRGKIASKVKLYAQEMSLAAVGSPLALETTRKNLLLMEDDE